MDGCHQGLNPISCFRHCSRCEVQSQCTNRTEKTRPGRRGYGGLCISTIYYFLAATAVWIYNRKRITKFGIFLCVFHQYRKGPTFQPLYSARTCAMKPEALEENSIWCVSLRICFYMWWFVAVRSLPTPGLLRWTLQDLALSCWEHLHPIWCHGEGACLAHLLLLLLVTQVCLLALWQEKLIPASVDQRKGTSR